MRMRLPKPTIDPVSGKESEGNIYTIALPIAVCSPLNADFDGDSVKRFLETIFI